MKPALTRLCIGSQGYKAPRRVTYRTSAVGVQGGRFLVGYIRTTPTTRVADRESLRFSRLGSVRVGRTVYPVFRINECIPCSSLRGTLTNNIQVNHLEASTVQLFILDTSRDLRRSSDHFAIGKRELPQ